MKGRIIASQVSQLITALLLVLATMEFGARVFLWHFASEAMFTNVASRHQLFQRATSGEEAVPWFFELDRYVGYRYPPNSSPDRFIHNNLGFRGEDMSIQKPEGTIRIAVLGSSLVYDPSLDLADSYPHRLQQYLREQGYNVEVINAGVANYTTLEVLTMFTTSVLELDPDIAIIYSGSADINQRLVWPPDAYRSNYRASRGVDVALQFTPQVWEYSTLVRLIGVPYGYIEPHSFKFDTSIYSIPQPNYYRDEYFDQMQRGTHPEGFFQQVSVEEMLAANPPTFYADNLRSIVGAALANDVEPVLMTLAYYHGFDESDFPWTASAPYIAASQQNNEIIREVAAESNTLLFDFADVMPREPEYFSDGVHLNEQGNDLRVPLVADYLIANGLLSEPENYDSLEGLINDNN
jgi:lysophospholipase L1-like esterase